MDGQINEIVCFIKYEIDEQQISLIASKRIEDKQKKKKGYREFQLDQMLSIYYENYVKKQDHVNQGDGLQIHEYNNIYLSEKKRCGIKTMN